jgi:hypothetical protein
VHVGEQGISNNNDIVSDTYFFKINLPVVVVVAEEVDAIDVAVFVPKYFRVHIIFCINDVNFKPVDN